VCMHMCGNVGFFYILHTMVVPLMLFSGCVCMHMCGNVGFLLLLFTRVIIFDTYK